MIFIQENEFIYKEGSYLHMGFYDPFNNGTYIWVDNGDRVNDYFHNWAPNQPSNVGMCGHFWVSSLNMHFIQIKINQSIGIFL